MEATFLPAVFKRLGLMAPIITAERVIRKKDPTIAVVNQVCESIGYRMVNDTSKQGVCVDPSMFTNASQWCWEAESDVYGHITVTWDTDELKLPDFIEGCCFAQPRSTPRFVTCDVFCRR